jgi:hypothetical protein
MSGFFSPRIARMITDQISFSCHPERSEGSRVMLASGRADGFFAALRMTDIMFSSAIRAHP